MPGPWLGLAGLPARCLDDPDLKIPVRGVARLLELAAARANDPAFGLRMVESRRLSNLGPPGLVVREEPTLGAALEALIRHLYVHNEALAVRVERNGPLVVVRFELDSEGEPARQSTELVVSVACRVLGVFMGANWRPRLVCFSHRAPPSLATHRRVFGDAVEFGHDFNGIVCNANLEAPNPGADPVMARYARRLLEKAGSGSTMTAQVRQLIVLLLPRGHCRCETVAQHLGIDRSTVSRRLDAEGTTEVVDGVRRDLVARYIEDGSRPLAEISALLGFAAPSGFSRWHRVQFGTPPRQAKATRVSGAGRHAGAR